MSDNHPSEHTELTASSDKLDRLSFERQVEPFRRELVKRYRGLRKQIEELYRRRIERDPEMDASPMSLERLSLMTFAMVNGMALEKMLEPDAVDDELYGTMLMIFFAGLRTLVQEGSAFQAG